MPSEKKDFASPASKKAAASVIAKVDARLDNKPGEPPFQLELEPRNVLVFRSDRLLEEPVVVELKIKNPTAVRQALKVKCTSTELFRVRMPFGFVEAGGTHTIKITFESKRVPEGGGRHFFALHHVAAPDPKQQQAKWVWTAGAKADGVVRLPCDFQKADGSQWTPEKK